MPKLENWDEEIRYPGNGDVLFNDCRSYKHSLLTERSSVARLNASERVTA